jgi:hypothetical protein
MNIMKKVWVYKRAGIKGWWIGWYENGKRKAKALPTRKLAEHSSPNLTNKVYTNVDPVLRHAVEQIPVGKWF